MGNPSHWILRAITHHRLEQKLAVKFRHAGVAFERLRVSDAGNGSIHVLRLEKTAETLDIAVNLRALSRDREVRLHLYDRIAAIADPFMKSRLPAAVGNISDGENMSADMIGFCSNIPRAMLVPDAFFYNRRGYMFFREASKAWQADWSARDDRIVWRGSTTGHGPITSDEMLPDNTGLLQRTRMCLLLRQTKEADARFVGLAQSADPETDWRRLHQASLVGGYLDPMTWLMRKFAIDIDGNTNAWSNLFTRLLAGCCVIKIASPMGYRQWYYEELRPWQHFVPVRADMSDLHETIDWCRVHDRQCAEIAASGRAFAMQRNFETENARATRMLDSRHPDG